MIADFEGMTVLVAGGTRGIGLATGLAFGRRRANCWLTYRWGSADEEEVLAAFEAAGAKPPHLVCADAGKAADTEDLLRQMDDAGAVDVLVSNVTNAVLVRGLEDYSWRGFSKTVEYTSWPVAAYLQALRKRSGRFPRYVVALSSNGPSSFNPGYDFIGLSKAALETLARHLGQELIRHNVRVNIVRAGLVNTDSLRDAFGEDFLAFARRFVKEQQFGTAEEVAEAIVGLCSGLMDGISGQVITVDRGAGFMDNLMRVYDQRISLGLSAA